MVINFFSILLGNIATTIIFDLTFREYPMREQALSLKKIKKDTI
jgi:hypothetical protein